MYQRYLNAYSLEAALTALAENNGTIKIVAGATDLWLELERGQHANVGSLLDISRIQELDYIRLENDGKIHIGAGTTHNQIAASNLLAEHALPLIQASWQVGSPQIRNRATLGGNLVTASPANDTIVPLMALDAELLLVSKRGERSVKLEHFYTGLRKTIIAPDELLKEVTFFPMSVNQRGVYLKLGLRKAEAISLINICIILEIAAEKIKKAQVVFGCVAPTVVHARKMEDFLIDKQFNPKVISEALGVVDDAIKPISDLRSTAEYRNSMVGILIKRSLEELMGLHHYSISVPMLPVLLSNSIGRCGYSLPETEEINDSHSSTVVNGNSNFLQKDLPVNLLHLIREDFGLKGTKEGCGEGECGACAVIMDGAAVMSCLVPAGRAIGASIQTIESLSKDDNLHPIQQAFIDEGAVQCGYCTPGFIISAYQLLEEKEKPSPEEIIIGLSGNLCRCTGYYKIIKAVEASIRK